MLCRRRGPGAKGRVVSCRCRISGFGQFVVRYNEELDHAYIWKSLSCICLKLKLAVDESDQKSVDVMTSWIGSAYSAAVCES
jgi:hypothetical protein